MPQKTVLISINASWNIVNFRRGLVAALQEAGYRVAALAPADGHSGMLEAMGVDYHPIEMDRQGVSPARDLALLRRYHQALRRIRPDIYLGYTAKPNIYGSLAAQALGIKVINNVAGLGTAFIRQGLLTRIVSSLYRLAFRRSHVVFFQNQDDMAQFLRDGIVKPVQARLIPGSGVDLAHFSVAEPGREANEGFRFLLGSRLMWDKGVGEYVEAARLVRREVPEARFQILGFLDVENRTAVSRADVERWGAEGVVEYLGHTDDVRPFLAAADCIVLPSYREGLPRILLEGAALGRPLVATDVPGCRQVVVDGDNGFLCEVRNPRSLADAMLKLIRLPADRRAELGRNARMRVERDYDERIAIGAYLDAIASALKS